MGVLRDDLVGQLAAAGDPDRAAAQQRYMRSAMPFHGVRAAYHQAPVTIICQLKSRADADVDLLLAAIEASITDDEFFLRKAIGWALREHSKTDPEMVAAYVADEHRLSPLGRREALRLIERGQEGNTKGHNRVVASDG